MKKIVALALALCLVLAAVPGFAVELLSGADTYPMDAADKTITWYASDGLNPHEKYADWTESPFHTNMSKQIGVNIEWVIPTTGSDGNTFTNTLLADPDHLPNIMKGSGSFFNNANLYLEDGLIWDLTPYIQEYAPAYYAFLQTNPAYDKAMKTDDGKYWCFGFFREGGGWNDTYQGPVIRTDWLQECGLEMPTTTSEFENVIRVFNEKYGAKFAAPWSRFKQSPALAGQFGGYAASDEQWAVVDGKVFLGQTGDGYRAYLSWLNKLWEEGLLDQDIFSLDDTSIKAKVQNGQIGIGYTSMGQMNNWNKECTAAGIGAVWAGCPIPKADDGSISCVFGGFGIGTSHAAVVTKTADEETLKLCLRALDYAYTQEGFLFWNYGIEGDTWVWGDEGLPVWTEKVANDTDVDPMTKYNGATWGSSCIQADNLLYLKNSKAAIEANYTWFEVFPDDNEKNLAVTGGWKWPVGTTFTLDESDELDLIAGSIGTYCTENFASFVTGTLDVDDDAVWAKYLADFETYNLSRITEIRQACYDRYSAR